MGEMWIILFTVFWYKNLFSVETYCIHYNIIPIVESYGFIQISSHGTVQLLRITYLISGVRGKKGAGQIQCRWLEINVAIWQFGHRSYGLTNTLANFLVHIQFAIGIQTRYKAFIDCILLWWLCMWAEKDTVACVVMWGALLYHF